MRRARWMHSVGVLSVVTGLVVALGACNLALGLLLALRQPWRGGDLQTVYGWCQAWLYDGARLYGSDASPDYPPNAIVTYAPMALVPRGWIVAAWATVTLLLTLLLPYAVMRASTMRAPTMRPHLFPAVIPTALFACWGGVRTLLQFSQMSLLLAFLPLALPGQWLIGGTCLALALAKPHIAGPIAVWVASSRRNGRTVLVAAGVLAAEWAAFCLRAGVTPMRALVGWTLALREIYSGPDALNGYTSVRPWIAAAIGNQAAADAVWISASVVLLVGLCLAAIRDRTRTLAIPALLCLWSLLTIYHNLNNLILMLPGLIFLLTVDDPGTRLHRLCAAGIIQLALMADVPVRLRGLAFGPAAAMIIANADRVVAIGAFLVIAWCWLGLQRAVPAAAPVPDVRRRNHWGAPRTMRNTYASGSAATGQRG